MSERPVIGLDYTAAVQQTAGIGRYTRELTAALARLAAEADLRLFIAGARRATLPPPPGSATYHPSFLSERNHNRLWQRLRLPVPVEAWTGRLDLFHEPDYSLPPTLPGTKTVLTVHDLAFEHYPDETMPGMLGYLQQVAPRSIRRADHVIAVSQATRRDLVTLYGTPPEKINVIPPGVDARFYTQHTPDEIAAIRRKYGLPGGPLVLTVGTLQPRKNHLRLVRAFAAIKARAALVIAGGKGWDYETVRDEVGRLGLSDRVVFTGFVDNADLPALYRAATVFAYPALYEGFGLPALEAMASGVPVVASNTSSLPEVVGEAGLTVDPLDVDDITAALDRLLGDASLRAELRKKGTARAAAFTWARAAEGVWRVYQSLLGERP